MTAASKEFLAFVLERLQPIGQVSDERLFGGIGLRVRGAMFGMLMNNTLYLVADDELRTALEKLGGTAFSYSTRNGRVTIKRFFTVPATVLEDDDQLVAFARRSVDVARARAAPIKSKTKRARQAPRKRKTKRA